MLMEEEGSEEMEFTLGVVEETRRRLREIGLEEGRVQFHPTLLPIYKALPDIIDRYVRNARRLGKLSQELRGRIVV